MTDEPESPIVLAMRVLMGAIEPVPMPFRTALYDAAEGIINAQSAMIEADISRTLRKAVL